jgi:hypothetical protein
MHRMLALLLFLLAAGSAGAEDGLIQCSPRVPPDQAWQPGSGFMTLESVADHLRAAAPSLKIDGVRQTALAVPTIELVVVRPDGVRSPAEWRAAWFEAVLHPAGQPLDAARLIRGQVLPPNPGDARTQLVAEFAALDSGWWVSRWDVFLFACVDPGYEASSPARSPRRARRRGNTAMRAPSRRGRAAPCRSPPSRCGRR